MFTIATLYRHNTSEYYVSLINRKLTEKEKKIFSDSFDLEKDEDGCDEMYFCEVDAQNEEDVSSMKNIGKDGYFTA